LVIGREIRKLACEKSMLAIPEYEKLLKTFADPAIPNVTSED